jgi:uncharacterized membrane protein
MNYAYLKAFHLIFVIIWVGGLMGLGRFLGYHVGEAAAVRERLTRMEKRMYFFVTLPGMIMTLVTGLLLLHGVGHPNVDWSATDFLRYYMSPRSPQNTFWYVTFHAKLTSVGILIGCDLFTVSQIFALAKRPEMPSRVRFSIVHGLEALFVIIIVILMVGQPLTHH